MSTARKTSFALALCLVAIGVPATAAGPGPQPFKGVYEGKAKGVSAKVEVNTKLRATMRYRLKTECGRSSGRVDLGAARNGVLAGESGGDRKAVVRLKVSADGTRLVGAVSEEGRDCEGRRKLTAELAKTDAFVPSLAGGHYSGTGELGTPIGFDVVYDPGSRTARVENLGVDVVADCYDEGADAGEFQMVTHIGGLGGAIENDGEVYFEYVPDDDYTEYIVEGRIADGSARLDVYVSGLFDGAGNPDPASTIVCDSWGEIFTATRG